MLCGGQPLSPLAFACPLLRTHRSRSVRPSRCNRSRLQTRRAFSLSSRSCVTGFTPPPVFPADSIDTDIVTDDDAEQGDTFDISSASEEAHDTETVGERTFVDSTDAASRPRRVVSLETRRKIAHSMLGVPKSAEMRAKLSATMKAAMKTRPPWNKGKTLSPETRARMSRARSGGTAWNKGLPMSEQHKRAIAAARMRSEYIASSETRRKLRLARRRPGDAIITGGSAQRPPDSGFPLVETSEINAFVTLRRTLRVWSDSFAERNGRRPSLADVRRTAPPPVVRDFELYTVMRDRIRGLAADVYGSVNPKDVPVVPTGDKTVEPRNNNHGRTIIVTKHGNRRLASPQEIAMNRGGQVAGESIEEQRAMAALGVESSKEDMWDAYDYPVKRPDRANGFGIDRSLFGVHEIGDGRGSRDRLSMNDYRCIGKYRLMESKDICTFVQLRRDLEQWSKTFREQTGRTPKLSDVKNGADRGLYTKFCKYLDMRHSMSGLMKEVYGTDMDNLETTVEKVNEEGKSVLDTLRSSVKGEGHD